MKLKAPLKGRFAIPEPDTSQVSGQVDFDVMKGIRLSTIDTFLRDPRALRREHRWKCIHGFSTNGRHLTLLNCRGHESMSQPGFPEGQFWATHLLTGLHYFDISASSIKTIAFRLTNLDMWLNRSGVTIEVDPVEFGTFRAEHKHPGTIPLYKGDRFKLSIWHSTFTPLYQGHDALKSFKEEAYLNVEYTEAASVEQATEDILMLRDLFSLWISAPIAVEDVAVFIEGKMGDPKNRFELYFPLGYECTSIKGDSLHYMLYPFDDLEPTINDVIARWVTMYPRIKRGISFYHEAYFSKNRHAYQKFIDYAFSYESVNRALHPMTELPEENYVLLRKHITEGLAGEEHKFMVRVLKYANECSLRKRMKESFKRIGLSSEFDKDTIRRHVDRMVNARNGIVHDAMVNSEETVSDENVVDYNTLLRILNVAELLLTIGLLEGGKPDRLKRDPLFAHFLGRRWSGL